MITEEELAQQINKDCLESIDNMLEIIKELRLSQQDKGEE